MNRTRGFVNLNRYKSGRAIKRLGKTAHDRPKKQVWGESRSKQQ